MLANSTRRFDLYDFFSVLVPGTGLLFGLFPFLPRSLTFTTVGSLVPLLLGGFIVGRALHSASVEIESFFERTSHRERFICEFRDPELVSDELVDQFYDACRDEFELDDFPGERPADGNRQKLETIYGLVRSYVHVDSRGRSRTFQAVYAFHRSMWFASAFLVLAYFLYGMLASFNLVGRIVDDAYISHFGSLDLPPGLIVLGAYIIAVISHELFSRARREYQEYFVQYLFSDFLAIQRTDQSSAVAVQPRDA